MHFPQETRFLASSIQRPRERTSFQTQRQKKLQSGKTKVTLLDATHLVNSNKVLPAQRTYRLKLRFPFSMYSKLQVCQEDRTSTLHSCKRGHIAFHLLRCISKQLNRMTRTRHRPSKCFIQEQKIGEFQGGCADQTNKTRFMRSKGFRHSALVINVRSPSHPLVLICSH